MAFQRENRTFIESSIMPMYDIPVYLVQEGAFLLVYRLHSDYVAERFRKTKPFLSPSLVKHLDGTGTTVHSGPVPLQSGMKISTIYSRFEYYHALNGSDFRDTNAVTGIRITLQQNERMSTAILATITLEINLQATVSIGLSPEAVRSLSPRKPSDEDVLDTTVPGAYVKLTENASTTFSGLFDAIKSVCSEYDTKFWQLTELYEMEAGDNLFRIVNHVLNDPLHKVQSKIVKVSSKHFLLS